MNGEPLELPVVGFADRGEGHYGRSQLVSCQRSLYQVAGLRIEMSRNFVEGHDLTSPFGAAQDHRPPFMPTISICALYTVAGSEANRSLASQHQHEGSGRFAHGVTRRAAFWRQCPTAVEWKGRDPRRAFGPNNRLEYVTWVTDGGTN